MKLSITYVASSLLFVMGCVMGCVTGCNRVTVSRSKGPAVFTDYSTRMSASGFSGTQLLDADRDMRVQVVQQFKSAVVNHYANLELKNKRIRAEDGTPFDSIAHLDQCIETEKNTADTSDIAFIDRMRICVAAFQDTHFAASARTPIAGVSTGFLVRNVGGKYLITARQTELLKYVEQSTGLRDLDRVLAIGNEVLEVDGQTPAQLAERYKKYISASSVGFRQSRADGAIFNRNFDYPTKRTVTVKIKSSLKTYDFEFPWWASNTAKERLDVSEYFLKLGIPVSDRVRMMQDKDGKTDWRAVPLAFKGYLNSDPLIADDIFRPLVPFKSEAGAIAARLGTMTTPSLNFCYAQLLTFSVETLIGPDGVSQPYIDTIRKFVKSCKAANLNLVMDLRSNGGGNGSFPGKILSLLTPMGATLGSKVMSFRVNSTSMRLITSMIDHPEIAARNLGDVDSRFFDEIISASNARLAMTNAIPESKGTEADSDVGGYEGKIVVLVTPDCVSACDGMAAILKRSGRAIVLGTHTNGTGAGFQGSKAVDSGFNDTFDELAIQIPNYQFGYTLKGFAILKTFPYTQVEDEYFTENKPTLADVTVEPTFDDVVGKKNSWLDAVLTALAKP